MGNFVNTLVILILFLCYDTWHPLNRLPNGQRADPKKPSYVTARLDGVSPPCLACDWGSSCLGLCGLALAWTACTC